MNIEKLEKLLKEYGIKNDKIIKYLAWLDQYFTEYNFSDKAILHFLANAFVETGNLEITKENLNYSASRLPVVFPSLFTSKYNPNDYAGNPQKLANLVYNSNVRVKSLGNFEPGDGYKYIGRGLLQSTGKENYKKLTDITGIDFINNPEYLTDPQYAVKSAVIYFNIFKLDKMDNLKNVRRAIAGSDFGYDHVLQNYNKLEKIYSNL